MMLPVEITWLPKTESSVTFSAENPSVRDLVDHVSSHSCVSPQHFYLVQNGRLLGSENAITNEQPVRVLLKVLGGKGGFGSMLRAIGAQIEKTTNREACRDLSGRRLRDINEEKRLKTWIGQQADRERQEAERKQRKLAKLRAVPKHEFSDKQYDEERSQLIDNVHDAVECGFSSLVPSTSSEPSTSKAADCKKTLKKKPKKKGFMFEDEELSLSESDEETSLEPEISSNKRELESNNEIVCSPSKKQKTNVVAGEEVTSTPDDEKVPDERGITINPEKETNPTVDEDEAKSSVSTSREGTVSV